MGASERFTVGLVQMGMVADPKANLAKALEMTERAAAGGARLIVLPELFRTLYFCQKPDASQFAHAEPIPGPTTEAFAPIARRHGATIVAPIFERRAAGLYHNSAAVLREDGGLEGIYRKMHIPHDPNFEEKYYFAPGDLGFRVFPTRAAKVGVLICWDQWYPEAARATALQGADILVYPTAIGAHRREAPGAPEKQLEAWKTIQRAHAIANGVFVAAVNRVGREDDLTFWGHSFLADPFGGILAEASGDKEEVVLATVDPREIEEVRHGWPFLRDRRIDSYRALAERYLDAPR
ncbi:MAG: carbon-nitrogen hydrolase [Methanobacteriota archaeon]